MLKLFLWRRYLRKKRIVFLSIAAVALSVSLLIIVASMFTGFINVFEQSAVDMLGDVVLVAPIKFAKYPLFIERLEQTSAVKAATAILSSQGLLHLDKGNVRMVEVWGIEPSRRVKVTAYKRSLLGQKDSPGEPSFEVAEDPEGVGGFVGIGVLAEPDEKTDEYDLDAVGKMVGRSVVLTTGLVIEQEAGDRFKRRPVRFTIVDVLRTGIYHHDKNLVYLPIEKLQKKLYPNEDGLLANRIQIKLSSDTDVESALAQIRGLWQIFAE
jgi:ABC-type lipoprotein release transport system permease subunit